MMLYWGSSFVLLVNALIVAYNLESTGEPGKDCVTTEFTIFQLTVIGCFMSLGFMLRSLRIQVDQIQVQNKIDRKINYQYNQALNDLRFILISTLIAQVFKAAYERTAYWTTGECPFAANNDLVENVLYFLNEPVQVMV